MNDKYGYILYTECGISLLRYLGLVCLFFGFFSLFVCLFVYYFFFTKFEGDARWKYWFDFDVFIDSNRTFSFPFHTCELHPSWHEHVRCCIPFCFHLSYFKNIFEYTLLYSDTWTNSNFNWFNKNVKFEMTEKVNENKKRKLNKKITKKKVSLTIAMCSV